MKANNAINADIKKRRAFVALLFTAGYCERYWGSYHIAAKSAIFAI
jgi:hypothetical protein